VTRGTKTVLIPPGTYRTTGAGLKVTGSGVVIMGLCETTCVLKHSGEGPAITLGDGQAFCMENKISNLKILGEGAQSDGILLSNYVLRYDLENVWVTGFTAGTGIKAVNINNSGHICRVQVEANNMGISIGEGGYFTDISFSKIFGNTKYGIEITDAKVINIISTQIEKNGDLTSASVVARGVEVLNLIGCYNEQNDVYPGAFLILTKGTITEYCRAVNLVGCRSIGNSGASNCVIIESARNVNFTGNKISTFPGGIFVVRPLSPESVQGIFGHANDLDGPLGDVVWLQQ
jgi:hypothetical protein